MMIPDDHEIITLLAPEIPEILVRRYKILRKIFTLPRLGGAVLLPIFG